MIRIPDARLDQLIAEDIPYLDLTSVVLGIEDQPGRMEYFTRQECVLAGMAVVQRIMDKLGLTVVEAHPDVYKRQTGDCAVGFAGAGCGLRIGGGSCG